MANERPEKPIIELAAKFSSTPEESFENHEAIQKLGRSIRGFIEQSDLPEDQSEKAQAVYAAIDMVTNDDKIKRSIYEAIYPEESARVYTLTGPQLIRRRTEFPELLVVHQLKTSGSINFFDFDEELGGTWYFEELVQQFAEEVPTAIAAYPKVYVKRLPADEFKRSLHEIAKTNTLAFIGNAHKVIEDTPYEDETLEILRGIADAKPKLFLEMAGYYAPLIPAPELVANIKKSAVAAPAAAVSSARQYKKYLSEAEFKEVIAPAIMGSYTLNPGPTIVSVEEYSKYLSQDELVKILEDATTKNPDAAFMHAGLYKAFIPKKAFNKIIGNLVGLYPSITLRHINNYEEVFDEALLLKTVTAASTNGDQRARLDAITYMENIESPAFKVIVESYMDNDPTKGNDFASRNTFALNIAKTKKILEIAEAKDPWFIVFNIGLIGMMLGSSLGEKYKDKIEIAGRAPSIPGKTIRHSDFPIDPVEFKQYLIVINQKSAVRTSDDDDVGYPMISIPMEEFDKVFYSHSFQQFMKNKAGQMSYMNAFSIAQTAHRLMERNNKEKTEANIKKATEIISSAREHKSQRELFGPNTKLILFTHEEAVFDNQKILDNLYYRAGGTDVNILSDEKGIEMENGKNLAKERTLAAIIGAEGDTTILFSGHGSAENWGFSKNEIDNLNHNIDDDPTSINYRELGDALIASKNMENFNLLGITCLAHNFIVNLFNYLESKKVLAKPNVSISAANKSKSGWSKSRDPILSSVLLRAIYDSSELDQPVLVDHFYMAEGLVWEDEDPAIFIPSLDDYTKPAPVTPSKQKPARAPKKKKSKSRKINSSQPPENSQNPSYYLEIGSAHTDNDNEKNA